MEWLLSVFTKIFAKRKILKIFCEKIKLPTNKLAYTFFIITMYHFYYNKINCFHQLNHMNTNFLKKSSQSETSSKKNL